MKKTNFLQQGGFPLESITLDKMQSAYFEILKAIIGHFDLPETGNYIISGCEVVGTNITTGMMYIDGELCPFAGATGNTSTKIAKIETIDIAPFENGNNLPTYYTYIAAENNAGVALSSFTRVPKVPDLINQLPNWSDLQNVPAGIVIDPNYLAFTQVMLNKLNGIENNAEVNVQADWSVTNANSDAFIKNKPNVIEILHKGIAFIGDIAGPDDIKTIYFPSVGTKNYMVLSSIVSQSNFSTQAGVTLPGWNWDNDFSFVIHNKTESSFEMGLREYSSVIQNLRVEYLLIPL